MSEVVKSNVPQAVLLQQLSEIGGNASGVEDIAHGIHKNIAVILFAVAISAYAPILLLLLPQRQQLFPDIADQRQGAQAGFRLGAVCADDFTFAVYLCVGYNVLNGDGVPLKVDGVPISAPAPRCGAGRKRRSSESAGSTDDPWTLPAASPAPPAGNSPQCTAASWGAPPCRRG